jgi:hypothetical protein
VLTRHLLSALCGEVADVLEVKQQGQVSLQGLYRFLELTDL